MMPRRKVHDFEQAPMPQTHKPWVSDKTKTKIPQIRLAGRPCAGAIAILTNAVVFHGPLEQRVSEQNFTADADFTLVSSKTKNVRMMRQEKLE